MSNGATPHYNLYDVKSGMFVDADGKKNAPHVNIQGKYSGERRCPGCGATELTTDPSTGKLKCPYCDTLVDDVTQNDMEASLTLQSEGIYMSDSAAAMDSAKADEKIATYECPNCGADVVVDMADANSARCHWCRGHLAINNRVANGAVPDYVLPFGVKKEQAVNKIRSFVEKHKFFIHKTFADEFNPENVCGVYMPYTLVDANVHAKFTGEGQIKIREYSEGSGDDRETYYDADEYAVEREFDVIIDDLSLESNSARNEKKKDRTDNIITSIMPFDTENCVPYDSNYLMGYTSEKRDVSCVSQIQKAELQIQDICRHEAASTLSKYDRGVRWDYEDVNIKSERWNTAYLPVWLYSYYQRDKKIMHYVAVNARTQETMGSVPYNASRLMGVSVLIGVACLVFASLIGMWLDSIYPFILMVAPFIYYWTIKSSYRNDSARHNHESETKHKIGDIVGYDRKIGTIKKTKSSGVRNANYNVIKG